MGYVAVCDKVAAHAEDKVKTFTQLRGLVPWREYCLNALADAVADAVREKRESELKPIEDKLNEFRKN